MLEPYGTPLPHLATLGSPAPLPIKLSRIGWLEKKNFFFHVSTFFWSKSRNCCRLTATRAARAHVVFEVTRLYGVYELRKITGNDCCDDWARPRRGVYRNFRNASSYVIFFFVLAWRFLIKKKKNSFYVYIKKGFFLNIFFSKVLLFLILF